MGFHLDVHTRSEVGRVRLRNEDSWLVRWSPDRDLLLAAVADGMGGGEAGDQASRLAIAELERISMSLSADYAGLLAPCFHQANQAVFDLSAGASGTTLTALLADLERGAATIAHVGDSRAYRYRGGTLSQLTRDDSWVQEMVESGEVDEEEAFSHSLRSVLSLALGIRQELDGVQLLQEEFQAGDMFILCTDGLTVHLRDQEIEDVVFQTPTPDVCHALVQCALELGGRDNVTVLTVEVPATP